MNRLSINTNNARISFESGGRLCYDSRIVDFVSQFISDSNQLKCSENEENNGRVEAKSAIKFFNFCRVVLWVCVYINSDCLVVKIRDESAKVIIIKISSPCYNEAIQNDFKGIYRTKLTDKMLDCLHKITRRKPWEEFYTENEILYLDETGSKVRGANNEINNTYIPYPGELWVDTGNKRNTKRMTPSEK